MHGDGLITKILKTFKISDVTFVVDNRKLLQQN